MPFPYKKILCPVDFDETSIQAVREASSIARPNSAALYLLHVVQINPLVAQGATEGLSAGTLYEAQLEFARKRLAAMLQQLPSGLNYELAAEVGEPGALIIAMQKKLAADLVVMATHGRRGLKRLVLGSIAERVVRECRVPVLTIRPAAD